MGEGRVRSRIGVRKGRGRRGELEKKGVKKREGEREGERMREKDGGREGREREWGLVRR